VVFEPERPSSSAQQRRVRRSDQLLRYVEQAKNNQSHNLTSSTAGHPGLQTIMIRAASPGGAVRIDKVAPGLDGSPFGPGGTFDVLEGMTTAMDIVPPSSRFPL
jgi:hypothetical protein